MPDNQNTSGSERRVTLRLPSTQETPCHFATLERLEYRWAKVRDLSPTGIGLVLDRALEPGMEVLLELPSKTPPYLHVTARVVRQVAQNDGSWLAGCVFTKPLTEAEFQALL